MLIVHSEKFGMFLATNTDIGNDELVETTFTRKNFGNFPNQECMHQ